VPLLALGRALLNGNSLDRERKNLHHGLRIYFERNAIYGSGGGPSDNARKGKRNEFPVHSRFSV
jgi:hypothetical protein